MGGMQKLIHGGRIVRPPFFIAASNGLIFREDDWLPENISDFVRPCLIAGHGLGLDSCETAKNWGCWKEYPNQDHIDLLVILHKMPAWNVRIPINHA